jgi:hypothetical protein
VSEEIVRAGIADRVVRLTVRMVLTALRCAAPSVASDCVASGCRLLPTILTSSTSARCALTHPKVSSPKMPRMLCLVCQQDIGMVVARIAPSGTVVSAPCWTNQTKLAQHHARWEKHSFERPSPLYGCKLACALQQ